MNLLDTVRSQHSKQLPFVVFCKPNSDAIVGVFQRTDSVFSWEDGTESGFAFVSFDGKQQYYFPVQECNVMVDKRHPSDFYFNKEVSHSYDENTKIAFEQLVEKGVTAIRYNHFQKVVLSRKEQVELNDFDFEMVFNQLVTAYPSAFRYILYHPKIGLWMGATPEQFIKISGNELQTVSLAGTQLFDAEVIWGKKERHEQQLVTDFISENLQQFSEQVTISEPKTIQAGNLAHLQSDISAVIDKKDVGHIINRLHPTPAVCGLPKESSQQFIVENEGYDREFYAGFLGELNIDFTTYKTENSDLFVNLRCMKVEGKQAHVFVGCGITIDSQPEKEFLETVNKSVTIKKVLNNGM